jgi:hypothetical protein
VSDVSSIVASACPSVTVWPTVTSTAVTRPDTPKSRPAWLAGSTVPEEDTVWLMVPVETVCTVVVEVMSGEALELVVANQMPTPAPTATMTAVPTMARFFVNHLLPLECTYASLAVGTPFAVRHAAARRHPDTGTGWLHHPIHPTFTPDHSHL